MALLVDVFGFLSVLLRGLALIAQSLTLGGVAFLLLLARPLAPAMGSAGAEIIQRTERLLRWSALALAGIELATAGVQVVVLIGTISIPVTEALRAQSATAAMAISLCGVIIAIAAGRASPRRAGVLAVAAALILLAQVASSHAAARVDGRLALSVAGLAHMAAVGVWIGGLPYLLSALARTPDRAAWRLIGGRYSMMSIVSVALLLAGGVFMSIAYVGSFAALYGTAYGVMVATKALFFVGLLMLGAMNFRVVQQLQRGSPAPVLRLRRFAEAELGIGLTVVLAAASLTSQPPGVDLTTDRVGWRQIVERVTPHWPQLASPQPESLAIAQLDQRILTADAQRETAPPAFVPGEGLLPPRNAMDIAWSEFNHHWAGLFVLAIGLLALLERSGWGQWARLWPLAFVALAVPMAVRADPEVWPIGHLGLVESLRDPEVVQHRLLECLTAAVGVIEWRVRAGRPSVARAALIFPLLCALGGALLVTHSHALTNVRDQLLVEISHVPLVIAAVVAAWSRWLQLRLDGSASRIAGWIWPLAFVAAGISLLLYREQ